MERKESDRFVMRQIEEMLGGMTGWSADASGKQIEKTFVRKNFLDAAAFVQQIAGVAEHMDHHPELLLFGYKNLRVTLSTHSAGGVTQNDFDLARAIDKLAAQ